MKNVQPAWLAVLLAGAECADPGTGVTLIRDGSAVVLSEAERSQIARRVEALIVGCAITSVVVPGADLGGAWRGTDLGGRRRARGPLVHRSGAVLLARQRAPCAIYDRIGDPPEKG